MGIGRLRREPERVWERSVEACLWSTSILSRVQGLARAMEYSLDLACGHCYAFWIFERWKEAGWTLNSRRGWGDA